MSRLLHAAARGARLQRLMQHPHRWENYQSVAPLRDSSEDRIHPDDAHLQYGPISTELRKAAENIAERAYLQDLTGVYEQAAIEDYATYGELGYCWDNAMNATAMQKQLFLLILAECLADEGM